MTAVTRLDFSDYELRQAVVLIDLIGIVAGWPDFGEASVQATDSAVLSVGLSHNAKPLVNCGGEYRA